MEMGKIRLRPESGGIRFRSRILDREHPAKIDSLLDSQFSVTGALGSLIEKLRGVLREGFWLGARRLGRSISGLRRPSQRRSRTKDPSPGGFSRNSPSGFVNGLPLVVIKLKQPGVFAGRHSTKTDASQPVNPGAVLVQRPADRLVRHGQPLLFAHGGLGAVASGGSRIVCTKRSANAFKLGE